MDTNTENDLLSKQNVVAVAEGEKWINGTNTGAKAILVFVEQKISESKLRDSDIIPKSIDGMVTDVVGRTGLITTFSNTERTRPLVPGYSCGHLWVTAGTLGGFFKDRDGDVVGLSNNHVLAATNRGRRWDGVRGHWTVQPGVLDDDRWRRNKVGNLKDYKNLIKGNNQEDSAIFLVTGEYVTDIPNIGEVVGFNDDVKVGDTLQKTGRTTGHKTATVIATNATVNVHYGNGVVYKFTDQIMTGYMSQGGDSGSLTIDMNNNVAGLLFAGSNATTIHNKIKYPRDTYGLSLIIDTVETITYTVKINDVDSPNTYTRGDFEKALAFAKQQAIDGNAVDITVSYHVEPSS